MTNREALELSVVIPVLDETEALGGLLAELESACDRAGLDWEAIVVDDGSTDGTFELVERLAEEQPRLRGVKLRRNFGKSAALAAGFAAARGERIVTIDGDGQDDPAEIPSLLAELDRGYDLISGWKQTRNDPWTRRTASKVFNWFTTRSAGLQMHDVNCGLKAYRRECAMSLEIYGEMHRFLPILAAQQGWRVAEIPVSHRPRQHGSSRFGLERYTRGALDLLSVSFLGRYQYRPLHLFGGIGSLFALIGVVILGYLTVDKISGAAIGQRPLLFLGVLLVVVGIQLLTLGLLGQMIVQVRRQGSSSSDGPQIERTTPPSPARPEPHDRERSATETTRED